MATPINNTSSKSKFTFFYTGSPFSQFYQVVFEVDGVKYTCAEQYMMHQKAALFEDSEIADQILKATKPAQMKGLGRKVKNFDEKTWASNREQIVKKGNMSKFSQNLKIKKLLLATTGTTLVEASPRDRIWGIGMSANNPAAQNKATWRGRNLLGNILTDVRDTLLKDEGSDTSSKDEDSDTPSTRMNTEISKFTFFYTAASPFSQFYPVVFEVDGVQYTCAEQYMMHQKAVFFEDSEIADQILKAKKPAQMKALGRKVRNFDVKKWATNCQNIVKKGNLSKFSQNPQIRKLLLATTGTTLVEASPHDRIWGIGMSAKNPAAQNKATWRGRNLLGNILTDVRDTLLKDEKLDTSSKDEDSC